jgi:hypothetical protein
MSTESQLREIRSARMVVPVSASDTVDLQLGYNPIEVQRVKLTALGAANIWALY